MKGYEIKGSGIYLGEKITSKTLDELYNKNTQNNHEKITGVKSRYYSNKEKNPSDYAAIAINNALGDANINIDEIDCIIACSASMEQAIPYNAAITLSKLKTNKKIATFDVNMTCLSFVQGLSIAGLYIKSGLYKNILVYSSEMASLSLNREETKISGLFGDGSAAFILGSSEKKNLNYKPLFETYSKGVDLCKIESFGTKHHPLKESSKYKEKMLFEMDGYKLFKLVGKHLPSFVQKVYETNNIDLSDLKMVIPHQASHLGLSHIKNKLNIPEEKFFNVLEDYGNQVAASIPLALHLAIKEKRIKRGDTCMLLGTSAGVSMGAFIIDY